MAQQQPEYVDAVCYVQVDPRWKTWARDAADNLILDAAKVVGITQTRPTKPKPGTVLVKLTLRIPAGAFLPLSPEAIVTIPTDLTSPTPVAVLAHDANDPEPQP